MCVKLCLGEFVALRRKELGFTQRAVATKLEVTTQHISNIETGRTAPSDRFCLRLAKILKLQPEFMILSSHREKVPKQLRRFFTKAMMDCKKRIRKVRISG